MIYHILDRTEYTKVKNQLTYHPESLEKEGFIHCSGNQRDTLDIANFLFKDRDVIIIEIDDEKLKTIVKWEKAFVDSVDRLFPHIFGELETKYIVGTKVLMKDDSGNYIDWKSIEL